MSFNSLAYFLFLPLVYLVFYFTAERWRWLVLLLASYAFYASWKAPHLLAVLLMVTGISYACGLRIAAHDDERTRKRWLWIGVLSCTAVLALLKYLPFLTSLGGGTALESTLPSVITTVGVSYFTFQAISYLADVFLEVEEPEKRFGRFALYLAFFPKVLQGPIERAGNLLPQLQDIPTPELEGFRRGLLLIFYGLLKKVVIADRLALFVDPVYSDVQGYSGAYLALATYAYAFQIYFDFSAYTDIARGTGRLFGIELTENFNRPYAARSISEFWRRWHMSFSRWILDYIFKPLQMGWRDWGLKGTALALMITFLVSGIWHGAMWGFLIWGLLHGVYLSSSTLYRPYQKRLHKRLQIENVKWLQWVQVLVTFNLVSFAWIFFRANTVQDAIYVATHLFTGADVVDSVTRDFQAAALSGGTPEQLAVLVVSTLLVAVVSLLPRRDRLVKSFYGKPFWTRCCLYYAMIMFLMVLGYYSNLQFAYVKF